MFSRLCKLCHSSADIPVINLRRYRISAILRQENTRIDVTTAVKKEKEPVPIIVCKRPQLNFYKVKTYAKFETIPLASQGWHHAKSNGDYFTINPIWNEEVDEGNDEENDEELAEGPQGFEQFCLHPKLIENLSECNVHEPTEIQIMGIPKILAGQHTVLSAETGCGKTFGFLLPILDHIIKWKALKLNKDRPPNSPYGLIITPSRELADQIGREAQKLSKDLNIDIKVLTGGRTKRISVNPSVRDVDLLIGSFGVVSKMTSTKIYKLNYVRHTVLDEAHALFDETFDEKLEVFLRRIAFDPDVENDELDFPKGSQLTLVSATRPSELPEYLNKILDIKSLINVQTNNFHRVMVPQKFMKVAALDKPMTLLKLVKPKALKKKPFIVFSNDSTTSDWISMFLNEFGVNAIHLNGAMPMIHRRGKFSAFQRGEYMVLSTTNAGARGLDTVGVNNIINYDFPLDVADYVHRCGRTGRIGSKGDCRVTNLIARYLEIELTQKIERATRRNRPLPMFNMLEEHAIRMENSINKIEKPRSKKINKKSERKTRRKREKKEKTEATLM